MFDHRTFPVTVEPHLAGTELPRETPLFEDINSEDSSAILNNTEIHGHRRHGHYLTPQRLYDNYLEPKYRVELDNSEINFSSPYDIGDGRIAVVGYVLDYRGTYVARSYYLSNSQGVWRYLPAYTTESDGRVGWYSKGHGEESTNLPFRVQAALASISTVEVQQIQAAEDIFLGTARGHNAFETYRAEIDREPQRLKGNFYPSPIEWPLLPPEKLKFDDVQAEPDFSEVKLSWTQQSTLYGEIKAEVFSSKDGMYNYLLWSNADGQSWVGGVEIRSNSTSLGVNERWVNAGNLTTPLFEYDTQSGGYGTGRNGLYTNMWENYLSKIPVIQEYLASRLKASQNKPAEDVAEHSGNQNLAQELRQVIEMPEGEQSPEFWEKKATEATKVRKAFADTMVNLMDSGVLTEADFQLPTDELVLKIGNDHLLIQLGDLLEELVDYIFKNNPKLQGVDKDEVYRRIDQQIIDDIAVHDPALADRLEGPPQE